jgi:hypothetical protein
MKKLIIWTVLLVGIAYGGSKWYLHHKVESGLDSAIVMMSPFAELSYNSVSSTMSGKLTVNGLRVYIKGFRDEILVDHVGIDTPSFLTLLQLADTAAGKRPAGSDFPEHIGIIVQGMRVPVDADYFQRMHEIGADMLDASDIDEPAARCVGKYGFSPATLADLGYDEQLVSFALYLSKSGDSEQMKLTATVDKMWDIDVDLALASNTQAVSAGSAMARRKLSKLNLELTDRSIIERVSKYCAQLGLSAEETLQAHLDALHFFGESNGIAFDEKVVGPYKEYLGGKSTLVIAAEPSSPLDLTQLRFYKPTDVPALLNLSVTAQ